MCTSSVALISIVVSHLVQAGYPLTDDMNGFQQEGVGRMDATIHKGQRWVITGGGPTTALVISKD